MEECSPTDAEIVERFMHKHVIVGEYFPKNNNDMGDVVPEHIDDMVRHLQGNFEEYVSQEYEWAMVEHPEWFGMEERDEQNEIQEEEEEEDIEMTEEEGIAHWQMMRAQMREEVRQEVLKEMRAAGAND